MGSGRRRASCALSWVVFCALSGLSGSALAQDKPTVAVDTRTSLYQDTDATTISTTVVGAQASPIEEVTVSGHYLADIITTASVDVVTAATRRWYETRHEGEGGVSYQNGTEAVSASYVYSVENDWESHTASLAASRDFCEHTLTFGLHGSFTTNAVGRSRDESFHETLDQGSGGLDAAFVLTKRDLLSASYTAIVLSGYQASPYRFVFFEDPTFPELRLSGPEVVPDVRVRHALGVRYNHHMFRDTALRLHVRGYLDDWGIVSGTGGGELVVGFGAVETAVFLRGYVQRGASFYQDTYDARYVYMTADRELSSFVDAFGGARVALHSGTISVFEDLRAELKATGFAFKFFDFERLPSRQGVVAELALGASL